MVRQGGDGETSMVGNRRGWAAAVLGAALLVGCGGGGDDGARPASATSSAASSAASSGPAAEEQAVVERVGLYYETIDAISAGAKVDLARLRAVAVDAWARLLAGNLQQTKDLGFVVSGEVDRTLRSVRVTGGTAEHVHCVDQGGSRMVKNGTPEPHVSLPSDRTLVSLTLVRESGVWKVRGGKSGGTC
jgi:hypothetical protein